MSPLLAGPPPDLLDGKGAVVTGAGSGIGRATAVWLAAAGAAVCAADVDGSSASETVDVVTGAGGAAFPQRADVSSEADVAAMVAATVDRYGRLDILFNNAAATGPDVIGRDRDLLDMDVDVWDATMAVNVRGPMLGCKHAIPHMIAGGGGSIVTMSSVAALAANDRNAAYGTSKAALIGFCKYVATMYGRRNVRCNNVAPGLVMTPAARSALSEEQLASADEFRLIAGIPEPEDIARVVLFLASDESRHITGQTVVVDGGMLTHQPKFRPA